MVEAGTKERIKLWRQHLGMTQEQFCKLTGVPLRTLRGYEGGTRRPGEEALAAIARTGVNMTWLLTGEGEMRQAQSQQVPPPQRPPELRALPGGGQQLTGAELDASIKRRLALLEVIIAAIDDDGRRATILDELLSRAQEVKRLDELEQAVEKLLAAQKPKD